MSYEKILHLIKPIDDMDLSIKSQIMSICNDEIIKKSLKETNNNVRYTACKKIIKDKKNASRPTLQTVLITDEFQAFTNSYMLAILRGKEQIKELDEFNVNKTDYKYPEVMNLIKNARDNSNYSIYYTVKELKEFCITKKHFKNDDDRLIYLMVENKKLCLDSDLLFTTLVISGLKNNDIVKIDIKIRNYNDFIISPLYFKTDEGSEFLVMPIRKNE